MAKQIFTKDVQALIDHQYNKLDDEAKKLTDEQLENLTDEQKEAIEAYTQQQINLAEIFAQCWDDEDFEAEFKANPKAVMDKFNVKYDDNVEYVVINNDKNTITYVLPYEGVKEAMEGIAKKFSEKVADVVEAKQIIPENWSIKIIQNTQDVNYIVIPMSPEKLTPEELEFVSGCGFFFASDTFIASSYVIAYEYGLLVETAGVLLNAIAVALLAVAAVAVVVAAVAVIE